MWLFIGIGVYMGVALAVLGMLSYIWLGDVRRARRQGVSSRRRYFFMYLFLMLMAAAWPVGLTSIWVRSTHQDQPVGEAERPAA